MRPNRLNAFGDLYKDDSTHFVDYYFSVFYVFYEQYVTIVTDACVQLVLSLIAIFAVATVLLGLDPWSAFIIDLTIGCILFNLIGLMYWWGIEFNAISVVNLVMVCCFCF